MSKNKRLALLSMMIALEILFAIVPFLGYIPLGIINATTLHIPVILTAIILGPKEGMLLGFIFGLTSLIKNTMSPNVTSFLFTPFYGVGNFYSLLICFLPRILIGAITGYLYKFLKDKINDNLATGISAFFGAFTNTCLVMSFAYIFFKDAYANATGISLTAVKAAILAIVFNNGIAEAIVAVIFALVIGKIAKRIINN